MQVQILKWGNSLGLRIPQAIVKEMGIAPHTAVNLDVSRGKLVVQKAARSYDLTTLLSKITVHNLHAEISTGKRRGKEVW